MEVVKEETTDMLEWEHSFVCCWHLDTMENRAEVPQMFLNELLDKNGEDQLDRSFEELKYNSITFKKKETAYTQ